MNEEIMRVLKMVEDGKIDAQKASELIEALNSSKLPAVVNNNSKSRDDLMLKVKVDGDGDKVNVQLPLKFIKGVIGACGKLPVNVEDMESIDMNMIKEAIDSGLIGKIVDVKTKKGETVEVVIE